MVEMNWLSLASGMNVVRFAVVQLTADKVVGMTPGE
jgi:hypothetical protein